MSHRVGPQRDISCSEKKLDLERVQSHGRQPQFPVKDPDPRDVIPDTTRGLKPPGKMGDVHGHSENRWKEERTLVMVTTIYKKI